MEKVNIKEVVNSARYFGQAKLKELNEKYSLGYLVSYDPGVNSCSWMARLEANYSALKSK